MGFHINVYNMPRIETYDRAKEDFDSRTVVRGESQSVRRLGDRYEKEKWIRKDMIDGIEVYVAGYYDTDLVRFYPTHKEITLGSYPSLSTQYFYHILLVFIYIPLNISDMCLHHLLEVRWLKTIRLNVPHG